MSLTNLTGIISAAALNNNFGDKLAALSAVNRSTKKSWHQFAQISALSTTPTLDTTQTDFTAPDDGQLQTLGLSIWNPDATSRTVSMTLTAIDDAGNTLTGYLPGNSVAVSVTGNALAEFNAVRAAPTTPIFLLKGVTYRLTFARTDANAGNVTRAYGFVAVKAERRYM